MRNWRDVADVDMMMGRSVVEFGATLIGEL
jgi:hypothetical protein